jgi:hypothetical protein
MDADRTFEGARVRMKADTRSTNLESFLVFDTVMGTDELAEPVILFSYCPSEQRLHQTVNLAGIFLALRTFASFFAGSVPCDYMATNVHEYALLELSNGVWMSLQRFVTGFSNRNLLLSILQSCQSIYRLLFPAITRDSTGFVSPQSKAEIHAVFSMLVSSISWNDLAFIHLFDSFFQLPLENDLSQGLCQVVHNLLNAHPSLSDIAIMHSRYFVFWTFPTEIARTLSMCIHMKLRYLFPKPVAKQSNRMYWIIGMSLSPTGNVSIYAPPISVDGQRFPLIALRVGKLRFIMTLKPDSVPTVPLLNSIPALLNPLRRHFRGFNPEPPRPWKMGSYLMLKNQNAEHRLVLKHDQLGEAAIPVAEASIFMAHLFGSTGAKQVEIAFPGQLEFSVYLRRNVVEETVVLCRSEEGGVTGTVKKCKALESM